MIRVLHFSDVHIQQPLTAMPTRELLTKRLIGGANLVLRRGKYFADAPAKLERLAELRREIAADMVICTGDLTALGTEAECVAARKAISGLLDAPRGMLLLPGNHDLYLDDAVRDLRFERHFGDLQASDEPGTDGPYPLLRLIGDELAIVAVNSARPNPNPVSSRGEVSEAQLRALSRLLDRHADRICIVMTHYGPLRKDGRPDSPHHGMAHAEALMRVCARARVVLVHGHIHFRYHHAPTAVRPWIFCAGSATYAGREGLWLYEVTRGLLRAVPGDFHGGNYRLLEDQALELAWL